MGLHEAVLVEGVEVHCPPWLAGLLGHHNHAGLPSGWDAHRDFLDNPELLILVQLFLDFLVSVMGDHDGFVNGPSSLPVG